MPKKIKVCIDRALPRDVLPKAASRSLMENPANVPIYRPGFGVAPPTPLELATVTGKLWQNGRVLRVSFLDGVPEVQAKVAQIAHEWSQYANLEFEFGSYPDAEIRISFRERGSWSYIGTDALSIPQDSSTMNYGWLTPSTAEEEYRRVVLHEFGHALGCIHEHQNPAANIPWDKEAVYRYYAGPPNYWSKADVDVNLFERYSRTTTQFSDFDPHSIMLYPIPNEHTIGDFEVGWNREISAIDKEFIGRQYRRETKETVGLTIDGPAVAAAIGKHGEEDLFHFTVAREGRYKIETEGPTDVVMALFASHDLKNVLAADDDSGRGFNAKIVTSLRPGDYTVRIRHYYPKGTGDYKISVQAMG